MCFRSKSWLRDDLKRLSFRVDRRKGRVGFSSVAENLLTVDCVRAPFADRVRDLRVTRTR